MQLCIAAGMVCGKCEKKLAKVRAPKAGKGAPKAVQLARSSCGQGL